MPILLQLLELIFLKTRSRIYLCSSLLLLIIGTIVSWQFRYVETGSVYWRDRPLEEITEWRRQNGSLAPSLDNEGVLEFSPQKGQQAISGKTWPVSGGEKIKVRVRYRSPNPIETSANDDPLPVSITIIGTDRYHRLVLDRVDHIVFESAPENWRESEAVAILSERAQRVNFGIIVTGESGSLQISDLDIVEVREAPFFPAISSIIWILWALWIFKAIKPYQPRLPICLLTTLWLVAWGGFLIFPRSNDVPRPFFPTFWMAPNENTKEKEAIVFNQPDSQKSAKILDPAPKAKQHPVDNARSWFKSFGGGRLLMHFGVMGVFVGGLLLLLPLRYAWPYILTMIVSIELLPAILIKNADSKDLLDLLTYVVAVCFAIPIASRIRNRFSPSAQSSQPPS